MHVHVPMSRVKDGAPFLSLRVVLLLHVSILYKVISCQLLKWNGVKVIGCLSLNSFLDMFLDTIMYECSNIHRRSCQGLPNERHLPTTQHNEQLNIKALQQRSHNAATEPLQPQNGKSHTTDWQKLSLFQGI